MYNNKECIIKKDPSFNLLKVCDNVKAILFITIYLYHKCYQGIQKERHPWVHEIDPAYWY